MRSGPVYVREASLGPEILNRTEWLLTNGLGGFAMGTASGAPARRYHALLVAAMRPPVGRMVTLSHLVERLTLSPGEPGERSVDLSAFRFAGGGEPGLGALVRFERAGGAGGAGGPVRWVWRVEGVEGGEGAEVEKEVSLARGANAVRVRYTVRSGGRPARLWVRPLVAMRDFHAMVRASEAHGWHRVSASADGVRVEAHGFWVRLGGAAFTAEPQWWYSFDYEMDRQRGQDHTEDLFSPGCFVRAGTGEWGVEIVGEAGRVGEEGAGRKDWAARAPSVAPRAAPSPAALPAAGGVAVDALRAAADQFVVRREGAEGAGGAGVSIIAGYPWFSDWGRDSMISLPGLLLCTGRHAEARALLETFAGMVRGGLIPNHFDNTTGAAEYNTVDASLWYLHAACAYARASGDRAGFDGAIRRACLAIIDGYARGTEHGIGVDPEDGLVFAGDATTQLTWMDAKRDGVVFTPRHGKAVEINALWFHGLMSVAEAVEGDDAATARRLRAMADRAGESLRRKFWWPERGCLRDVLTPAGGGRWEASDQVRCNQIFAVSLRHSALTEEQRRGVVGVVRERLLTRHGLRTLDPADPAYRGRFQGPLFERDGAYHNGTVWPWLMGAYVEAVLRVGGFSAEAKREGLAALGPLIAALDGSCPGQLAEVYDGDDEPSAPQRPGGCPAQAWSVGEVLRGVGLCGGGGGARERGSETAR